MRDLKFRAWFHANPKDYVYQKGKLLNPNQMFIDSYPGECFRFAHEGQPVELMQYTGLRDKNGKEIYEGDILLADNDYVDEGDMYLEVRWNDKQTGFYLYDTKHDIDCDPDEFELISECYQVIGNIYETPELLNV
jgi:uncharacterized phage protein (TIGR01671 family)